MKYKIALKYANTVDDVLLAFQPGPLTIDELDEFYYDKTMEVRTGDSSDSPIDDIYDACKMPLENNPFLLLGHRGCGKSTELNVMSRRLKEDGYKVFTIPCGIDMDTLNPDYSDILILMGDALLQIAGEARCKPSKKLSDMIEGFWTDIEQTTTLLDEDELELQAGITAETPPIIRELLKLSFKVKSTLKFSEQRRTTYRDRISRRLSEWTQAMNELADIITEKMEGKQPILIFEDLDKLEAPAALSIFLDHAPSMSDVTFPTIYTFPIALSYDTRFRALDGYFNKVNFPMIKLQEISGERYEAGYKTIEEIVKKRADLDIFGEDALDLMIEKTGGSLRDLFGAIIAAATRARRRRSARIELEDAHRALEKLKTELKKTIDGKNYRFLADISRGNRERIEDKEMLLKMLQAGTVLEYNGKGWYNVHPLVNDFLIEQGILEEEGSSQLSSTPDSGC